MSTYQTGLKLHRATEYTVTRRETRPSYAPAQQRPSSGSSVLSGLKSMFSYRSSTSSSRAYSANSSDVGASFGSSEPRFKSTLHPSTYVTTVPRREPMILKTSDSFPVLSPQLEDRLLQLADRSRRLGVHRFSRTRNSLILNEHTLPPGQSGTYIRAPTINRYSSSGSNTSISTKSSGTIQRMTLPPSVKPSGDRYTAVRE